MKKSFIKAYEFALKNEGKLLTLENEYFAKEKSKWICKNNHIFFSTYGNLISFNRWCVECSGTKKFSKRGYTIEDCKNIAKKFGGKCLSTEIKSVNDYILWECKSNHIWKSKFCNVINSNNWCRKCSRFSKAYN